VARRQIARAPARARARAGARENPSAPPDDFGDFDLGGDGRANGHFNRTRAEPSRLFEELIDPTLPEDLDDLP
jgi:hypothetical protein